MQFVSRSPSGNEPRRMHVGELHSAHRSVATVLCKYPAKEAVRQILDKPARANHIAYSTNTACINKELLRDTFLGGPRTNSCARQRPQPECAIIPYYTN